jgi:hypothetical protein
MTGKAYYLTTLADWQRHSARFATSHFIALDFVDRHSERSAPQAVSAFVDSANVPAHAVEARLPARQESLFGVPDPASKILVLIEADEGVHLLLEDDPAFEPLPHPLAQQAISPAAQSALAPHGVAPGATTFDVSETFARVHPLLKHRVF